MKERPILFSGEMVQAILDGRKTQTRRVVKPQPVEDSQYEGWLVWQGGPSLLKASYGADYVHSDEPSVERAMEKCCVHGKPGEKLWVKETWRCFGGREYEYQQEQSAIIYKADSDSKPPNYGIGEEWKPSIFMPRWASRLTLEITNVRVERLQDISEDDAKAEGAPNAARAVVHGNHYVSFSHRDAFCQLWESINRRGSWVKNPWVWVIEFRKIACAAPAAVVS